LYNKRTRARGRRTRAGCRDVREMKRRYAGSRMCPRQQLRLMRMWDGQPQPAPLACIHGTHAAIVVLAGEKTKQPTTKLSPGIHGEVTTNQEKGKGKGRGAIRGKGAHHLDPLPSGSGGDDGGSDTFFGGGASEGRHEWFPRPRRFGVVWGRTYPHVGKCSFCARRDSFPTWVRFPS
jgi:hypothetical protein